MLSAFFSTSNIDIVVCLNWSTALISLSGCNFLAQPLLYPDSSFPDHIWILWFEQLTLCDNKQQTQTSDPFSYIWCHVLQCFNRNVYHWGREKGNLAGEKGGGRGATRRGKIQQQNEVREERVVERGEEGKSDSFFNIRLAGDVFLHSSVCLCVYFPVAVSFTALGITHTSTVHSNIKSWLTGEAVQRPHRLSI